MTDPEILKSYKPPAGSIFRSFVQLLVIVSCLFLIVRTIIIEPFGVTTGSMAFTLHGNNRQTDCPRCGCRVVVGSPTRDDRTNPQQDAYCPNCGFQPIHLADTAQEVPGDRLLVDKLTFQSRAPRRWEMAVFHCPVDDHKPYVKRVVGLPGDSVRIFDGDIYVHGELQRKPWSVIREMKIPIVMMDYPPEGIGWAPRWRIQTFEPFPKLPKTREPRDPPPVRIESVVQGSEIHLDALHLGDQSLGLTYRHRNLDTGSVEPVRDRHGFNGGVSLGKLSAVHDFILEAEVEIKAGTGVFSCRLTDGADTVTADIPIVTDSGTAAQGLITHDGGQSSQPRSCRFLTGKRHTIAFAFVDRSVHLILDGEAVGPPMEIPPHLLPGTGSRAEAANLQPAERSGVEQPVQIGVRGASVVLRHLVISRDVHYRSEGKHAVEKPCLLGSREYFVLGDNSPNSKDSREWEIPGVPEGRFIGKPFFTHQPLKETGVPVNGRIRSIRGLDWDRMKLSW